MTKRTKYNDVVTYVNGVKTTICAPRKPRQSEITYPRNKSRYTAWAQGVTRFEHGTGGVLGTVR